MCLQGKLPPELYQTVCSAFGHVNKSVEKEIVSEKKHIDAVAMQIGCDRFRGEGS